MDLLKTAGSLVNQFTGGGGGGGGDGGASAVQFKDMVDNVRHTVSNTIAQQVGDLSLQTGGQIQQLTNLIGNNQLESNRLFEQTKRDQEERLAQHTIDISSAFRGAMNANMDSMNTTFTNKLDTAKNSLTEIFGKQFGDIQQDLASTSKSLTQNFDKSHRSLQRVIDESAAANAKQFNRITNSLSATVEDVQMKLRTACTETSNNVDTKIAALNRALRHDIGNMQNAAVSQCKEACTNEVDNIKTALERDIRSHHQTNADSIAALERIVSGLPAQIAAIEHNATELRNKTQTDVIELEARLKREEDEREHSLMVTKTELDNKLRNTEENTAQIVESIEKSLRSNLEAFREQLSAQDTKLTAHVHHCVEDLRKIVDDKFNQMRSDFAEKLQQQKKETKASEESLCKEFRADKQELKKLIEQMQTKYAKDHDALEMKLNENSRIVNDKINNERRNREHAADLLEESLIRRVTDDYDQIRDVAHEELVKTAARLENEIGTLRQALDAEVKGAQDWKQSIKDKMELQLEQQSDKTQESMCNKLSLVNLKIVDLESAIAQQPDKWKEDIRQAKVQVHADNTSNINNAWWQINDRVAAQNAELVRIEQKLDGKTTEWQNKTDNFIEEYQYKVKHMANSQTPLRDLRRRPNPDTFSIPQYGPRPAAVTNTEMATTHGQHHGLGSAAATSTEMATTHGQHAVQDYE